MTWTLDTSTGEFTDHTGTVRATVDLSDGWRQEELWAPMFERALELIDVAETEAQNGNLEAAIDAVTEFMHVLADGAFWAVSIE